MLHTADWHLGHQLYGYDRREEFIHFFECLREIVSRRKPDLLVVSGDIFDVPSPSAAVQRLFTDSLLGLSEVSPQTVIVVIAGNHDSPSRLETATNLWLSKGIHVLGLYDTLPAEGEGADAAPRIALGRHIIDIPGKGVLAAAPFIIRHFAGGKGSGSDETIYEALLEETRGIAVERPAVLAAHVGVIGNDSRGHDRDTIGNLETVPLDIFGRGWSYVALGHIHRRQSLTPGVRYSGSPIAVSFDEDYPHGVDYVEIADDGRVSVEHEDIAPCRPLVTFPGTPAIWSEALEALEDAELPGNCYLRLNLLYTPGTPVDVRERAIALLSGRGVRFCTIRYQESGESEREKREVIRDIDEFAGLDPVDVALRYLGGKGFDDLRIGEFREMLEGISSTLQDNGKQ